MVVFIVATCKEKVLASKGSMFWSGTGGRGRGGGSSVGPSVGSGSLIGCFPRNFPSFRRLVATRPNPPPSSSSVVIFFSAFRV